MAVCIVLNRSYRVRQKTKKEDIPFQHGKGRFPATRQEGTKQFPEVKAESSKYPLRARRPFPPTWRAESRQEVLAGHWLCKPGGPQTPSDKPSLSSSPRTGPRDQLSMQERMQGEQVTSLKFQRQTLSRGQQGSQCQR